MNCEECDRIQDDPTAGAYYFRFGRHNVMVICCEEAASLVQEAVRG